MKIQRVLAQVARDLSAVDHADQKFYVRPGRAAFKRALLIKKLAFKTNGEYLLGLARKDKKSRDESRGERRLYAKKFDPFHPFIIPAYSPRQVSTEAIVDREPSTPAVTETIKSKESTSNDKKSGKGPKRKESSSKKGENDTKPNVAAEGVKVDEE